MIGKLKSLRVLLKAWNKEIFRNITIQKVNHWDKGGNWASLCVRSINESNSGGMQEEAFVEGIQILNAVLVASETINSILECKGSVVLFKLDIDKVYDYVD